MDGRHFNYDFQEFYIFSKLYRRYLYHLRSALVPIPHERVRLPPQNAKNPALKPRNRGMLGCKTGQTTFQL